MKLKSILLTAVATISLASATMAQVPNYVSTNGLVGWWPFNGNANDESGNGNNGTVNGAALTSDRNGQSSSAYNFNVNNWSFGSGGDNIYIPYNPSFNFSDFTISTWVKRTSAGSTISPQSLSIIRRFQYGYNNPNGETWVLEVAHGTSPSGSILYGTVIEQSPSPAQNFFSQSNQTVPLNQWCNIIMTYSQNTINLYIDNQLVGTATDPSITINTIGNSGISIGLSEQANGQWAPFDGSIDDIGIWNRALTQQEITDLYNTANCSNNTSITPQTNSLTTGGTASFTATTSDPNPSYVWQSDLGQGFQTLNNFGNYTGTNTGTLNIANVQLPNHTQSIRVITTSGNCIDTSNVAVINILDTCITNVTVYDTLLTTVTDTLVINALITGINPPNNLNTLKVYPNPANTHITIDYGNFNAMSGYTLTIVNSIGQTVFTSPINQQSSYIDLSSWTGNGIYFVQLIDPQNNTVVNRKIVIQ